MIETRMNGTTCFGLALATLIFGAMPAACSTADSGSTANAATTSNSQSAQKLLGFG
jgi:hypothetical protein